MKRLARKIIKHARRHSDGRVSMPEVVRIAREKFPTKFPTIQNQPPAYFKLLGQVMKLVRKDKRLSLVMVTM